jgi:predicted SAM-dependent methyltransferase
MEWEKFNIKDNVLYLQKSRLETESSLVDSQSHVHDFNKIRLASTWDITTLSRFIGACNMIAKIGSKSGKELTVIDLGCSSANLAQIYYRAFKSISTPMINYVGIDWRERTLRRNSELVFRRPSVYIQSDVSNLELPEDIKPDIFIAMEIIEHFAKEAGIRMVQKMYEYLPSSGWIYMSSPNTTEEYKEKNNTNVQWPDVHIYEYSKKEIQGILIDVGFSEIEFFGWNPNTVEVKKFINERYNDVWDDLIKIFPTSIVSGLFGCLNSENCKGWIVRAIKP